MDNERLEQIRARSKFFTDAGVAIGGYGITKSPLFSDRYKRISEQIPLSLRQLKSLIGENNNQQVLLGRVETTILDGMKTFTACIELDFEFRALGFGYAFLQASEEICLDTALAFFIGHFLSGSFPRPHIWGR